MPQRIIVILVRENGGLLRDDAVEILVSGLTGMRHFVA